MLKEFLELLGKVTGKTYTRDEFRQIIKEAVKVEELELEEKPAEKPADTKKGK